MANNNNELARRILELLGGKDNITYFGHCLTRLRILVKDKNMIHADEIRKTPGIVGTQWVGDQLQIIIGQNVQEVYDEVCKVGGIAPTEVINELLDQDMGKKKFTFKSLFNEMVATITACITPILLVFTAGGLFKLFAVLLGPTTFGILPADHDLVVLFSMVGDTCFRFFPVFIAYSAAKRFGASIPLALILACLLLHPTLIEMVDSETRFTVYGIPMIATSYANSFLPSLLITWVMSKVERFFKKLFPSVIRNLLYPVCTLLVMVPLALCVLGPIGTIFGYLITEFISWLQGTIGPLATGITGAVFPLLIVTGMHHALNSAAQVEYVKKGFDTCVFAATYIMDFQLMSLCFATLLKSKKKEDKAMALNCIATEGLGGISEPTIFGIMLKSKRNIAYVLLGGFLGGFYIGLMNVKCYILAPCGFMSVLAYTGGSVANLVNGIIACVIAFVVPFVLALIFGMEDKPKGVKETA